MAPAPPPRVAMGVDPGVASPTGIAVVEAGPRLLHAEVVKGADSAARMVLMLPSARIIEHAVGKCWDALAVESQEAYRGAGKNRATPDALVKLAHVAGAAAREYSRLVPGRSVHMPAPKAWKGSVKKWITHRRVCEAFGWEFVRHDTKAGGWCEPVVTFGEIKGSQWSHVLDAIGLALWALKQES